MRWIIVIAMLMTLMMNACGGGSERVRQSHKPIVPNCVDSKLVSAEEIKTARRVLTDFKARGGELWVRLPTAKDMPEKKVIELSQCYWLFQKAGVGGQRPDFCLLSNVVPIEVVQL